MGLTQEQLYAQFSKALDALNVSNRAQAIKIAEYCEHKLGPDQGQADVLRIKAAAASADSLATAADVQSMYALRHTWGELVCGVGRVVYKQPESEMAIIAAIPHPLKFAVAWGVTPKLTTISDLHAAAAWGNICDGQWERADAILQDTQQVTPVVQLVRALLFYRTRRWTDAITAARDCATPLFLDATDTPMKQDGEWAVHLPFAYASAIISGTAWAYLDNKESAVKQLEPVAANATNFPALAAEAYRMLGLLERRSGDEDTAQKLFGAGLSLATSPELLAAKNDPKVSLTVTSEDMIAQRGSYWSYETEPALADALAAQAGDLRAQLLREATAELAIQIGMEGVKRQVEQLQHDVRVREEMKRRGIPGMARTNHLVFSGPPGTGKTTLARVIAKIYAGYGVTRTSNLVEASRKDLVEGYEGQSAKKAGAVIDSARGGVLFIDEAYSLIQDRGDGRKDPFGQEAVDQLLVALENDRSDLIVIIAGYEADLNRFLATNEGLRSRFTTWLRFESYSPLELAQIVQVHARLQGSRVGDESVSAMEQVITNELAGLVNADGRPLLDVLGNGRFSRNVAEKAESMRARRLASVDLSSLDDESLLTLTTDDLVRAVEEIAKEARG